MLRFVATLTIVLGAFTFVNANSWVSVNSADQCRLEQMLLKKEAPIDPVVRRGVLKECSSIWSISYLTLQDAYDHQELTIVKTTYQGDTAYDVFFDGNFACVLEQL